MPLSRPYRPESLSSDCMQRIGQGGSVVREVTHSPIAAVVVIVEVRRNMMMVEELR